MRARTPKRICRGASAKGYGEEAVGRGDQKEVEFILMFSSAGRGGWISRRLAPPGLSRLTHSSENPRCPPPGVSSFHGIVAFGLSFRRAATSRDRPMLLTAQGYP